MIEICQSSTEGVWYVYFPYNAERLAAFKAAANGTATWDQGLRQWLVNRRGIDAVRAWVESESQAEADAQAVLAAQARVAYAADRDAASAIVSAAAARHAGRVKVTMTGFRVRPPENSKLNTRFKLLLMKHGFEHFAAQDVRGIFSLQHRAGESEASHAQRLADVVDAVADLIWGDEDQVAGAVL